MNIFIWMDRTLFNGTNNIYTMNIYNSLNKDSYLKKVSEY